jgi:cysteine desulfurase
VNGSWEHRLPGNLNMSFVYVEGESLLMGINDIAVSSGSACTSATLEPSYVLKALGLGDDVAHSSIRFGLGRFNTQAEVDYVAAKVIDIVKQSAPAFAALRDGAGRHRPDQDSMGGALRAVVSDQWSVVSTDGPETDPLTDH